MARRTIADELRAWRQAKGLTRKQAAELLRVNLRSLEHWEQGNREPTSVEVIKRMLELGALQ